ncbi:hypothetical protein PAE9249_02982 [Paenibacillus sp. CECT 9249]|uniref:erythromycin esterase family protein n=1 Tax=Paenibacillus sp. CECT 9249 TaxID=2845385 RepID=UPI001E3B6ECD|nr:erythromycin esterase family protein [Paenibacillus sp. CECT 9249]CAH0120463.1 hypothetical protein PAE9249_02982 [Paenibacillus sp. CECT 9249]
MIRNGEKKTGTNRKRWTSWSKPLMLAIAACMTLFPANAIRASAEEPANPYMEMIRNHANNRSEWKAWMRENANPIASVPTRDKDEFADLQFLKPLLQNQRIVMLGESSHGVKEFNSVKARLVRFLHQELGFDVVAFESGWADAYAVNAQATSLSGLEMMKKSIFPVWHTKEVQSLFEYIRKQAETDHPLELAGVDMQPMNAFTDYIKKWLAEVDKKQAEKWNKLEDNYSDAVYSPELTWDELKKKRPEWIQGYEELKKFVRLRRVELSAARPDRPELASILERAIDERIRVLNDFAEARTWLYSQDEKTFEIPTSVNDNFNYIRDLAMAEHLTWLAEEMYPDKKIIVWGHNYHLRKQNTSVQDDLLYMGLPMPTLGELLPDRLKDQVYSVGLYMYQGETASNTREAVKVQSPHDPGSLEAIMKLAGRDAVFVDMKHQRPNVGNAWMFTPRKSLYWGMLEETFVPRNQYDGIIWIDTAHLPDYIDS